MGLSARGPRRTRADPPLGRGANGTNLGPERRAADAAVPRLGRSSSATHRARRGTDLLATARSYGAGLNNEAQIPGNAGRHRGDLAMSDNNPAEADPFGRIADEFVEAFRQGQRPSVEEFARRYPEHADDIHDILP